MEGAISSDAFLVSILIFGKEPAFTIFLIMGTSINRFYSLFKWDKTDLNQNTYPKGNLFFN